MDYQKLEEAFLQGAENEAAELFNAMMRKSVRLGLMAALEEEVTALCGPRYRPDEESPYHRAGSEKGSVYLNGTKEPVVRPRVRHEEDGEVELQLYKAARSQRNLFRRGRLGSERRDVHPWHHPAHQRSGKQECGLPHVGGKKHRTT